MAHASPRADGLFSTAIWFGITAGLIEGLLLLVFQRINWQQWGRGIHVSSEILWISPLVDAVFFLGIAIAIAVAGRFIPRLPAFRVLIFVLAFLSIYDWMALTHRFNRRSCLLLALGAAAAFIRWTSKREPAATAFWKKSVLWVIALLALTFAGIQGGGWLRERIATASLPAAATGSPNVLVVVIDTLRADHVSAYGYARKTTPEIDRLASQGVLFENAIAPCSWSLPSHASLLTGRYPLDHGMVNVQPMPWLGWGRSSLRGYPTLGEELQKRGYRTAAFSANRVYFTNNLGVGRGFMHFEDYFDSISDSIIRTMFGREFARLYLNRTEHSSITRAIRSMGWDFLLDKDAEGSGQFWGAYTQRKRANVVNRELLNWLNHDRDRPFFAFLNYFEVHDPYGIPASYRVPPLSQAEDTKLYDDGAAYADEQLGVLTRKLERNGLAANTLVVITSDHGEALGDHGLKYHGTTLQWEQIHVPLVVWYPGHAPSGARIAIPVSNASIPATVLDMLPASAGGNSFPLPPLGKLWRDSSAASTWPFPESALAKSINISPEDAAAAASRHIRISQDGAMNSVVSSRWHEIVQQNSGVQLYNRESDPEELNDLVDDDF